MNIKVSLWISIILTFSTSICLSQNNESTMFIFGHSLINHELQIFETPSQETSVPHWLHFLAESGGKQYKVSGQYGFLNTHINLPPIAQWGFDSVEGAWESDYDPFAEADFTHVLMTPANFIQWQGPNDNYINENISPVDASNTIINWCEEQEPQIQYYIYENWPDMGPFLGADFPPSGAEWIAYNEYTQGEFSEWFDEFYQSVQEVHTDKCVKMIPVGRLISRALETSPFDQMSVTELYEDNAPHGRPSIYFMAAMISYMAVYEEITPASYQPTGFVDPIIADNYQDLSQFFWEQLLAFNETNGESKVFCDSVTSTKNQDDFSGMSIFPNPTNDLFYLKNIKEEIELSIMNSSGTILKTEKIKNDNNAINMTDYPPGIYFVQLMNSRNNRLEFFKLVKT